MRHLFLASILFSSVGLAQSNFNLPTKFLCNGKWNHNLGGGICHDTLASSAKVKIKIPPTKGQFRAVNCERELTKDGNPDDFNTATWKSGWWLWQKTIILPSKTPEISFPLENQDNCPISMSLAAMKTGVQSAIVLYEKKKEYANFLDYSCANGEWIPVGKEVPGASGNGTGFCRVLEKSSVRLRLNATGITEIVSSTCQLTAKDEDTKVGTIIRFEIPSGLCIIDVSNQTLAKYQRARIVVYGLRRDKREIDNPTQFADGTKKRVVRPIGTDFMHSEIYSNGVRVWSSGERTDDVYHLDPAVDNGEGLKAYTASQVACHTAYSATYESVSGSCYNLMSNTEVPYMFE